MTDPKDKLMDALLREHASDEKQRDNAIAAIEAAIDSDAEQQDAPSSARILPRVAAAVLLLSVAGIAGLAIYEKMQAAAPVIAEHQMSPSEHAMVESVTPSTPRGALESQAIEEPPADLKLAVLEKLDAELAKEPLDGQAAMDQPLVGQTTNTATLADAAPAPQSEEITRGMRTRSAGRQAKRSIGLGGAGGYFSEGSLKAQPGDIAFAAPDFDRERYGQLVDQVWISATKNPLSTFSIDVDTASYTNLRRVLTEGGKVQPDAVRIEEMINYFDYDYPQPDDQPFAVQTDLMECPWNADHHLVRIGIQGKDMPKAERPVSNLVFLIDVSGSMSSENKLPLLRQSLMTLLEELDARDKVSIVVYAGAEGLALAPTQVNEEGREKVRVALDKLAAGGSTNGGAGIKLAYKIATEQFIEGGVNRVILASDGDFNVGVTGDGELVELVKKNAQSNVFLSVLGFGGGNLNDAMMESITNDGNGNYYYIDSEREGRKVFLQNLTGTLVTIAKDVKIQVDFNPSKVQAYRLIGYSNRRLRDEDFNNDKVDAGDIGAGHTVTALYEVVPHGVHVPDVGQVTPSEYVQPAFVQPQLWSPQNTWYTWYNEQAQTSPNWLTVRLRHKKPEGNKSELQKFPLAGDPVELSKASDDFKFAAGVALFGMKLRDSKYIGDADWVLVEQLTKEIGENDVHGYREELRKLVGIAKQRDE